MLEHHPLNRKRKAQGLLPLNALATQRAGQKKEVTPFHEKWGFKALSISSEPLYQGLARSLGLESRLISHPDPQEDLFQKLELALNSERFDFVHVHTKAPDEAAHTKNPWAKKEVLSQLDQALAPFREHFASTHLFWVITGDHSTPSDGRMIHSGEPLPLTFAGPGVRRDRVLHFNEIDAAQGALGFLRGEELMYSLLSATDRAALAGLKTTLWERPYLI